eukprot:scaffold129698_cov23-Prasinocladus_malaysianus.AAC.2
MAPLSRLAVRVRSCSGIVQPAVSPEPTDLPPVSSGPPSLARGLLRYFEPRLGRLCSRSGAPGEL